MKSTKKKPKTAEGAPKFNAYDPARKIFNLSAERTPDDDAMLDQIDPPKEDSNEEIQRTVDRLTRAGKLPLDERSAEEMESRLRTLDDMRHFDAMRKEIGPWPSVEQVEAISAYVTGVKGAFLAPGLAGPTTAGASEAIGVGSAFVHSLKNDSKKRKAIEKRIFEKVGEQQILFWQIQIHQTIARIMDQLTRTGEYDIRDKLLITHLKREIVFLRDGMPLMAKGEANSAAHSVSGSAPRSRINVVSSGQRFSISDRIKELATRKDAFGDKLPALDLWSELFSILESMHLNPREDRDKHRRPLLISYDTDDNGGRGDIKFLSFKTMLSKAAKKS